MEDERMSFRHSTEDIKNKVKVILDKLEFLSEAEVLPETDNGTKQYLIDDIRALARDIANDSENN
jgi:hypothetical protein